MTADGSSITNKSSGVKKIYEYAESVKSGLKNLESEKNSEIEFIYSGVPFHSYESSSKAQSEITVISTVSMILVILLCFFVFRNLLPVGFSVGAILISVLFALSSVIFKGAKYYMNIFINYKYTPAHKIISNSFALFVFYLVLEFSKWEAKTLVGLIGFVVCLLGSLIYNEIIIITVWDLDRDTSEEINNRAINESNQIIDSFAQTTLENLHEENEEEVDEDSPIVQQRYLQRCN